MKKRVHLVAAAFLSQVTLASCAAVTKSSVAFHEEALRANNDVLIYVFRLESMVGYLVPWSVHLDGKVVGVLQQKAYLTIHTTPGVHTLTIGDNNQSVVSVGRGIGSLIVINWIDLKNGKFSAPPGAVYYFRSKGFGVAFLSRDEAMPDLARMKYDTGMK